MMIRSIRQVGAARDAFDHREQQKSFLLLGNGPQEQRQRYQPATATRAASSLRPWPTLSRKWRGR
jgi:hypothetical protein